jgi:uncharacterized protein
MANWDKIHESGDVEDRRGSKTVASIGSIGVLAVVGILMFAGGADPSEIMSVLDQVGQNQTTTTQGEFVDTKNYLGFAKKILGSNNQIWKTELAKQKFQYTDPKLVLFRGSTMSGCGGASSQSGPHYCPADQTIYLDETFFEELKTRFGAKGGEVAESYVMAHEVGHHVQNQLGIFAKYDKSDNQNSVRTELQADCLAGIWAGNIRSDNIIDDKEIELAIDAASAVGDDSIQKKSGGGVHPETWTHGSSADRKKWFLVGYNQKNIQSCNTFEKK